MKSLYQYITESKDNGLLKTLAKNRVRGMFITSDSLYDEAVEKFGEDAQVINPAYTRYEGNFWNHAVIEYFKENLPDLIVWEETSYDGQNAICVLPEGADVNDIWLGQDDFEGFYYELEHQAIAEEAVRFCDDNDCGDKVDEVEDWLSNNASVDAVDVDYDYEELQEYIETLK